MTEVPPSAPYLLTAILVMAAATQFTRAFPFLLFSRRRPPRRLIRGARLIPGAVMTVLVLSSLPLPFLPETTGDFLWHPWAAAAAAALLHLSFRQPMVSILGSTALYLLLELHT